MILLNLLKPNPANPRIIKDDKFEKLCQSIKDFPQMMQLRPIIVDKKNTILGGNMRYKALQHLGYKEIPDEWIKYAADLTPEQIQEFIIKDNVGFGAWDWSTLANDWDYNQLTAWGLDVPGFDIDSNFEEKTENPILGKIVVDFQGDEAAAIALYDKLNNEGYKNVRMT